MNIGKVEVVSEVLNVGIEVPQQYVVAVEVEGGKVVEVVSGGVSVQVEVVGGVNVELKTEEVVLVDVSKVCYVQDPQLEMKLLAITVALS